MYVYDPTFSYRNFLVYGFEYRHDGFGLAPEMRVAAEDRNTRIRVEGTLDLWRPHKKGARPDGSYLVAVPALSWQHFFEEEFRVASAELTMRLRLDTVHLDPALRGAFVESHAGIGVNQFRYDPKGRDSDENGLLLAGFGVGMYYGDARRAGGEVKLSFDQRHDDYAAGLKLPRVGSGVIGHFGLHALHYLDEDFGLYLNLMAGSALVADAGLVFRSWR
jgi:hypothetical protein